LVKSWDAIVAGGGVIGLSLALELRRQGRTVLVVERHEPGREASHASAGMLAPRDPHTPEKLRKLAAASAAMWPEFAHQLEDESSHRIDLRREGSIIFAATQDNAPAGARELTFAELTHLEPQLTYRGTRAFFAEEMTVDARELIAALLKAAKHRGVEIASGIGVTALEVVDGRVHGVETDRTEFRAPVVINCCGAWAAQLAPLSLPVRPVKGQMLVVIAHDLLRHSVRDPEVYIVPRSDGRVLVGATQEEAGFDKHVAPDVIQRLHQAAANLVPQLGEARMHEAWAGLRPGTPDDLPLLGATGIAGYFVSTGHFRNGILLTPVTARVMAQLITGHEPEHDLGAFSPERF
jgi:glycine oxidase